LPSISEVSVLGLMAIMCTAIQATCPNACAAVAERTTLEKSPVCTLRVSTGGPSQESLQWLD
jgi:hypothetical protein